MNRLEQVAAPTAEPVSLDAAKLWLRVTNSVEDDQLKELVSSAREYVEEQTGLSLALETWRYRICPPVLPIELPRPPFKALVSVSALLEDGTTESRNLADFVVRGKDHGVLALADDAELTYGTAELVVDYTTEPFPVIPARALHAIRMVLAHWYESRGAVEGGLAYRAIEVPHSVQALLDTLKIVRL